MQIRRLDAPLGSEVLDLDLREPVDAQTFASIRAAFAQSGVLVVRGQAALDQAAHAGFSRLFGELEVMKVYTEFISPVQPAVFVVSNIVENGRPIGLQDAGRVWHTDGSFRLEPPMGSLLHAIEIPRRDGQVLGDTLFASMSAAYEALPEELRQRLHGLWAVHRLNDAPAREGRADGTGRTALREDQKKAVPEVAHPVVRLHPITGRPCLYVNRLFTSHIIGMDPGESARLIEELCEHAVRPEFIYRHRWTEGDIVIWDNCSTQHNAIGDYGDLRRRMHRVTVKGTLPVGADGQTSRSLN